MTIDGRVETPLHPNVLGLGCQTCKHSLYLIARGYKDGTGRSYVRHYCWCGMAFAAFYE